MLWWQLKEDRSESSSRRKCRGVSNWQDMERGGGGGREKRAVRLSASQQGLPFSLFSTCNLTAKKSFGMFFLIATLVPSFMRTKVISIIRISRGKDVHAFLGNLHHLPAWPPTCLAMPLLAGHYSFSWFSLCLDRVSQDQDTAHTSGCPGVTVSHIFSIGVSKCQFLSGYNPPGRMISCRHLIMRFSKNICQALWFTTWLTSQFICHYQVTN